MTLNNLKTMKKERGFTIVELLIVIVVIGILAAIVIVAYNGVTQRAKSAKSAATASSIFKKMEAYNAEIGNYPATYSLLTGAATTTSYYIAPASYTLKTTAVAGTDSETTFNLKSCTAPAGFSIVVYDYANSAPASTYYGGASSTSTCTTFITT